MCGCIYMCVGISVEFSILSTLRVKSGITSEVRRHMETQRQKDRWRTDRKGGKEVMENGEVKCYMCD